MAFKAVIHSPSTEQMREINKAVAQLRMEKTVKCLTAMGVTNDTLQNILQQEKTHNTASKAG